LAGFSCDRDTKYFARAFLVLTFCVHWTISVTGGHICQDKQAPLAKDRKSATTKTVIRPSEASAPDRPRRVNAEKYTVVLRSASVRT